jgi:outer membrane protein
MNPSLPLSFMVCLSLGSQCALAEDLNVFRIGASDVAPHSSTSDAVGPFLPTPDSGVSLKVKDQSTLFFSYARKLDDQYEFELAGGVPPTHNVVAKLNPSIVPANLVAAYQGQTIAKVRQFAPTVFVNYKFGQANDGFRPFIGLGVNYTKFDQRTSTALGNGLNGGPTDIQMKDSWGLAAQVGADYKLNDKWSLHGGISTAAVKSTITTTTSGATRTMDIRFQPLVFTLAAGYSF